MALPRLAAAAALAVALAACGGSSSSPTPRSDWMDVPGMRCGDGTPTGIAISRSRADAVLVFLAPGGACWSATSCNTVFKSFSKATYDLWQPSIAAGTILDRGLPGNPFADWTQVLVPYCTGDVHLGDSDRTYGGTDAWHHHGWKNLQAAVGAMTAALPRPAQVVVAGSSAGGFGALGAFELVRAEWDPASGTTATLLDDSGPTLVGTAIPPALLSAWWDAWGLGSTIGVDCPACASDMSSLWTILHGRRPQDRLALVSTTMDAEVRMFLADAALGVPQQSPADFEANLDALATELDPLRPQVATYRVGGPYATDHALLLDRFFFRTAQGSLLLDWLTAMVGLDPAWTSSISR
jgi:hypothetical protein